MFRSRGQQQQQQQQQPQAQTIKPKRGKLLGRGKGNSNYHRLSPLKENSPSKPKPPPPTQQQQQQQGKGGMYGKNLPGNSRQSSNSTLASSNNSNIPTGFSQAELFELQESFKLFDIHSTGSIQVGDLSSILKTLQQEQHSSHSQNVFPHLDTLLQRLSNNYNDEDTLTLDDYVELMASTTISSAMTGNDDDDERNNFAHVFRLFDVDGKGYITVQDLERVAAELGEHDMTRDELEDMIQRAKEASSGGGSGKQPHGNNQQQRVGIEEFTRVMTMNLFPRSGLTEQHA